MQTGEDAEADGRERQIGAGARHAAPRPHAVSEQGEVAGLGIKGKNMQLVLSYKPTSLGKTSSFERRKTYKERKKLKILKLHGIF